MAVIDGFQAPIFSLPWGREKISKGNRKKGGFDNKPVRRFGAILFEGRNWIFCGSGFQPRQSLAKCHSHKKRTSIFPNVERKLF